MSIVVDQVSFRYGQEWVLKGLHLEVDPGAFVAIIGPNGGGKTTFLKLLMGFLEPLEGRIEVFGRSVTAAQQWMGYVPQSLKFDPHFPITVEQVVLQGLLRDLGWFGWFPKRSRMKAWEMLEYVGVTGRESMPFSSLSGGQQQRVLLARALVSKPSILFLDEPTANMDPKAQALVYECLRDRQEMTVFFVSHDLHTIARHASIIYCLEREGKQIAPEKLCHHYALGVYHPPL